MLSFMPYLMKNDGKILKQFSHENEDVRSEGKGINGAKNTSRHVLTPHVDSGIVSECIK